MPGIDIPGVGNLNWALASCRHMNGRYTFLEWLPIQPSDEEFRLSFFLSPIERLQLGKPADDLFSIGCQGERLMQYGLKTNFENTTISSPFVNILRQLATNQFYSSVALSYSERIARTDRIHPLLLTVLYTGYVEEYKNNPDAPEFAEDMLQRVASEIRKASRRKRSACRLLD